jgi:hypothetical protein
VRKTYAGLACRSLAQAGHQKIKGILMKNLLYLGKATGLLTSLMLLNSCMKDRITRTFQIQTPVYQTLAQARTSIKAGNAIAIQAPGRICTYKNYIFLNENSKGVHVIDNTDPQRPEDIAFINIPGNTDISVKNDILYANEVYGDLVAFDIRDPRHITVKKFLASVFYPYAYPPGSNNPDSILVITGYTSRDTTITVDPGSSIIPPVLYYNCANCLSAASVPQAASPGSGTGTGTNGSISGFAILGSYLYALSSSAQLNVVDLSTAADPVLVNQENLSEWFETIYPFGNKLFMGSYNGMYIYDVSDPSTPVKQGSFAHVRVCDPVITDGEYAYVTLHSGTSCLGYTNELDILGLTDLSNPPLLKVYPFTNPRGLAKDGNLLFICDGGDGLKVYDAGDVNQLSSIKTLSGFEANDVIAQNGIAVVLAADGLYEFDYSDPRNIHLLSKIESHASL